MGKKNKKGSGDEPNENKPPNPNQNKGKGSGPGNQQGNTGNQNQPGEKGKESNKQPQQQGGGQQPGRGDRSGGGPAPQQQQGAWGGGDRGSQQTGSQQQGDGGRGGHAGRGGGRGGGGSGGAWGGGDRGSQQTGFQQQGDGGRGGYGGRGGGRGGGGGGASQQQQSAWGGGDRGSQQTGFQQQGDGGRGGYGGRGGGRGGGGGGASQQQQSAWGGEDRGSQQTGFQQQGDGGRGGHGGRGGGRGGGGGGAYQQQQSAWGGEDRGSQQTGFQQQGDGGRGGHGGRGGGRGGGGGGAYQQQQSAWSGGDRGSQQTGDRGGYGGRGGGGGDRGRGGYGGRGGGGGDGGRGGYGGRGGRGGFNQGDRGGAGGYGDRYSGGGASRQSNAVVRVPPPQKSIPRGTLGQKFELETNYLMLDLKNMPDVAYHYDVKIDPDRPKKFLRVAFNEYVKKIFPEYSLAYDGQANAYSPVLLPSDKLGSEITVDVLERDRKLPFKVTLKATDDVEIDLKSLKSSSYHIERIFDKPMRALQCIEVVLSTPCHEIGVRAGRSFFKQPRNQIDLGDGFELWYGLYQAAMLCDQPLLNVDVSHKSFPTNVNLLNFYQNLRFQSPKELTDFLKGLRVKYKPPACFKGIEKEFKFVKVMDASSRQTFKTDDGKQLTVQQYFESKGYKLLRPDFPCLHVGSTVKNIYIPLELLEVPSGQAIMRKDTENQVRNMIKHAATSTDVRKSKIMDLLESFNFYMHPTVERFGISVDKSFITVSARLLSSPTIEYCQGKIISIDSPGAWMNRGLKFYKCDTNAHQWAILNISQNNDINEMFLREHFVEKIVKESYKLGMNLSPSCHSIKEAGKGRGPINILDDLKKLKQSKVSLVFVILPYNAESYSKVKQQAELSCGIVTQCIKGDTMRSYNKRFNSVKIIDAMTIGNILLKVNAKLNGTNHKISPTNEITLQKSKVMFVGADVSHPSPLQTNLPSIVGVVASHDLYGTQYNMQYRLQTAKLETIEDMLNIMTQHLNVYKKFTKSLPDHIIYYRDGVSDGQFPLISKIEVSAMRTACKQMECNAKFTVIIVVKRHHTRFFPKQCDGEGKYNNVKAGTVVDQTICHPNETQFFLVSHKAIQGTSKPTRYNVIIDDAKINIDDLQALTYNLCHLFPRCNRSVSYPAPAYLAHLVGLRGRAYIEGSNLNLENLKAEYSKRVVSSDIMSMNPMYFV
ncbi:protein argonaute-2 [Eupeodes corollae]|uniref:protein argonaute-2 n=1 Tax=Eupeodes corollae TaxID=290404 RepID=UPI0024915B8C|nr:protein argonaute-2 [Eupeodes corollae]